MRRFEYHEPTTLEDASRLMTTLGEGAFLLAGGTDLFVEIRERLGSVLHLINIKRVPQPSADSIPPLIADGAIIQTFGPEGGRSIPLAEFFTGPGRSVLRRGEIALSITVPPPAPGSRRACIKHGRRKAMELATVGVTVSLETDGRICTGTRIALGAVGPVVLRAPRPRRS